MVEQKVHDKNMSTKQIWTQNTEEKQRSDYAEREKEYNTTEEKMMMMMMMMMEGNLVRRFRFT